MAKVFEKAKDKNVAVTVLYVKDAAAYYDEACTVPVQYAEDAIELFMNGAVVASYYNEALDGYDVISRVGIDGAIFFGSEGETNSLPSRPEPALPEDIHTIPENKWNNAE